ncbi:hypothetical protein GQX73_g10484 [Xylaria multiplex]|uniref:Transcription factor domain-containing protein n=1 Tax=Xylaria multiplex TaxID=323545 RepID=A0A7C8MIE2_9PEZI|nr:hypothetical protein GQX73_g10484 [Xylaria multiplex]
MAQDEREFEFPAKQKWCRFAGKRLAFIDETVETSANHREESCGFDVQFIEPSSPFHISLGREENTIPSPSPVPSPLIQASSTPGGSDLEHGTIGTDVFSQSSSFPDQSGRIVPLLNGYTSSQEVAYRVLQRSFTPEFDSQADNGISSHCHDSSFALGAYPSHVSCLGIRDSISTRSPIFPLKDLAEAQSMRYYIDQVAPIFDFYDRQFDFARGVPEAAGLHPMLMSIISTVATRHQESFRRRRLYLMDAEDRSWYAEHHEGALATGNGTLGRDIQECESTELCNIFETQAAFLSPSGLHQAAFWAGVRQEVYLAVLNQRSTTLCLDKCNVDCSLEDAEDEVWMARMTLLLVDVLEFCFGPTKIDVDAFQKYESLVAYLTAWAAAKPESFESLFTRLPEDGEIFPEIVFLSNCAMAAWQFYHVTRMLLIAHNPRVPRIGCSYLAALQSIDNEIKSDVKILCGIAETSGNLYSTSPAAIAGIVLAGDRFTDRREQQTLFDFLVKVEKSHAWPTWSMILATH